MNLKYISFPKFSFCWSLFRKRRKIKEKEEFIESLLHWIDNIFVKSQLVNILGFEVHIVFVLSYLTTQFYFL